MFTFGDQNLTIYIDEKWFYVVPMKRKIRRYAEDEYPGDDTAKYKSHIPILAAIGKPTHCLTELNLMAKLVSGPLLRMLKLIEGLKIVVVALWKLVE